MTFFAVLTYKIEIILTTKQLKVMYIKTIYGNYAKEEFLTRCKLEISVSQLLEKASKIAFDVIKDFDSKVANVKVQKAIQAELDRCKIGANVYWGAIKTYWEDDPPYSIRLYPKSELDCAGNISTNNKVEIYVYTTDGRMCAQKTTQNDSNAMIISNLQNHVKECTDAIKNFDRYIGMITKLNAQIKSYNEKRNALMCEYVHKIYMTEY